MGKYIKKTPKRLFRFHSGSLVDSLATTIEVASFEDIEAKIEQDAPYITDIYIDKKVFIDRRLPEDWGFCIHHVMGDCNGTQVVVGTCNFYE